MAPATHSPEAKIANGIVELGCAESNFAKIAGVVGKSRLAEGLSGLPGTHFAQRDAEKMLAVLQEMRELRDASAIPPDWKQVDEIRAALTARREAKRFFQAVQDREV